VAPSRKAIQSLRLRLHSGLRQRGRLLRSWLVFGTAEAVPLRGPARTARVFGGGGDGRERSRVARLPTHDGKMSWVGHPALH
jgi:hypothetical protein